MVKALGMLSLLNTPEEDERLKAGKIALRSSNPKFQP